jgi:acyl-coenzyme A thioesterase PaaI-like protein
VWDVPPPEVAARARRQGSGTGWAIGLGTLLLIAGITAPAALWQEPRQNPNDQDQVATLTPPAVAPQPETQGTPSLPQQADRQAAPQQATREPPAPSVQAPSIATSSAPQPSDSAASPAAGAPAPDEASSLSAIDNTGELNPAPVTAPRAPNIPATVAPNRTPSQAPSQALGQTLASRPKTDSDLSAEQAPDPMVPHPFVPEAAPRATPFRPEQATGQPLGAAFGAAAGAAAVADSVSVPVASAPVQGGPATISLKPSLSGQLKPTQTADVATARPVRQGVTRKPRPFYPQSLDQMFQNLVDTLSEGKPMNPSTKPLPPGNRR